MKKYVLILLAAVCLFPLLAGLQKTETGDNIQVMSVAAPKCPWRLVATLADPNTSFGVDDRLFTDIVEIASDGSYTEADSVDTDPNWVVWKVPPDARTVQLTSLMDADGDDAVVEVWLAADRYIRRPNATNWDDSFALGTTITWKAGTQVGPGTLCYSDTASASDQILATSAEDASGGNRVSTVTINVEGYQWVAFLGTTVDSNCYILARWSN